MPFIRDVSQAIESDLPKFTVDMTGMSRHDREYDILRLDAATRGAIFRDEIACWYDTEPRRPYTIQDLHGMEDDELLKIDNFGKKALGNLRDRLDAFKCYLESESGRGVPVRIHAVSFIREEAQRAFLRRRQIRILE